MLYGKVLDLFYVRAGYSVPGAFLFPSKTGRIREHVTVPTSNILQVWTMTINRVSMSPWRPGP